MTESKSRDLDEEILARFTAKWPMAVAVAQAGTHLLARGPLDQLFTDTATTQYAQQITFSSMVHLMGDVVLGAKPHVSASYKARRAQLGASLSAVYEKLKHTEPTTSAALVTHVSSRARAVMAAWKPPFEPLLPGYRVRILDGNHQACTDRRLKVARASVAGPRPSMAVVVYEPQWDLPVLMVPSEDAYTQERALAPQVLTIAEEGDCWLGDRNFCTTTFLCGFTRRRAKYLVREHGNAPVRSRSAWRKVSADANGIVEEQEAVLVDEDGTEWPVRRIRVLLTKPTRDGEQELRLLSTVPSEHATATQLAALYRQRWQLETAFARLEKLLNCELKTLGHPRAALFAFAVGLAAYALVSVLQAALNEAHGAGTSEKLSWYWITQESEKTSEEVREMVGEKIVAGWGKAKPADLAAALLRIAQALDVRAYFKVVKKKPTQPAAKRTRFKDRPHVSTHRLLNGTQQDPS
jgi:hypothetical protein